MKTQEFLIAVRQELDTIKTKATQEEIANLDFKTFKHSSKIRCIYGQMTGLCNSQRAIEIMAKVFVDPCKDLSIINIEEVSTTDTWANFTPLEIYLYTVKESKHEEIINFLKGCTDQIEITL